MNAPYGYAYGYLDRSGRVRAITVSKSEAAFNARLNDGRVVRLPLTASGTVACDAPHEEVDA